MQAGAQGVFDIGNPGGEKKAVFDFSTPAGWALFWWFLAVVVIVIMFFSL